MISLPEAAGPPARRRIPVSKLTFLEPLMGKGASPAELINASLGSVLAARVDSAFDSTSRKKGLLGRDAIPEDYALIIAPCSAVHTIGMRTPIDIVFVTKTGIVTKTCRAVPPWRAAASLRAFATIEAAPGWIDRHGLVPGETLALRRLDPATAAPPPAGERATPATPARRHATRRRVTLADIVGRKMPVAWFESVALTQEVIAAAQLAAGSQETRVPELKHIAVLPDGMIELLADGPAWHSAVHRIGLLLLALTPEDDLPLQLRLLVLDEVAPTPRLAQLADLQRELGFYERPDRRAIIRDVFGRFASLADADAQPAVPAPLLETPAVRRKARSRWTHRRLAVATLAACVVLLALVSLWAWSRPEGRWVREGVAAAKTISGTTVRKASEVATSSLAAAKRLVGIAPVAPAPASPAAEPVAAVRVGAPPVEPLPARPIGSPAPGTLEGSALTQTGLPSAPDQGGWRAIGWVPGSPVQPTEDSAAPGVPTAVYSAVTTSVASPDLVSPKLRRGLPAGVRIEDLSEVEIVVSETGEVESAKFVTPMRGMKAAVMLSAVKAWHFQPATLDGKAVRYRFRVRLIG